MKLNAPDVPYQQEKKINCHNWTQDLKQQTDDQSNVNAISKSAY